MPLLSAGTGSSTWLAPAWTPTSAEEDLPEAAPLAAAETDPEAVGGLVHHDVEPEVEGLLGGQDVEQEVHHEEHGLGGLASGGGGPRIASMGGSSPLRVTPRVVAPPAFGFEKCGVSAKKDSS